MDFLSFMPSWSLYIIAGLIGAILGSFANVCIIRMPKDKSVVWPRSQCPFCGHKLTPLENIPIISFIFLRGRCKSCKRPISLQYPIVEILMVTLSILAWWYFYDPIRYLVYVCLFILPLLICSVIDIKHFVIPDSITLPGIAIGFVVHVFLESRLSYAQAGLDSLLGVIIGGGALYLFAKIYEKIKKQEGLGGGDVKLIAMLGAFFGWRASILILLMSSFLGSVIGLVLIIGLRKGMKYAIPFGPFLAAAGLIYLFLGTRLIGWYVGLFI